MATLWGVLSLYAAKVAHDFYHYVDRSIYVAVDDGEAGIAYSLATEGRYGFLASPTLVGMPRTHGQFNYGPWYFYLAAGLIWVFGYSLTLIRSIHLWVIIGSIVAAAVWFRGRDRAVATALFGFGILYCFEVLQWPMARPDSMVAAFAVVLIVCAGAGMRRPRPAPWFFAGVAAVCGAFTHLIAAGLLPSAALLFAAAARRDITSSADRRAAWRRTRVTAMAFCAGLGVGLTMFYASFGFRVMSQLRFLVGYRVATASPDSFTTALMKHFHGAFGYLGHLQVVVWATLAAGMAAVALTRRLAEPERRLVDAYLLPPLVAWIVYLVSNGWYTNYHLGYGILHQVLFLWTAAALAWVSLTLISLRWPAGGSVATTILAAVLMIQGVRQLQWQVDDVSGRAHRAQTWVAFADYSNEVLGAIPARSTAWGSVMFGIETPDRIQLLQMADGLTLLPRAPRRPDLVPDFTVWGYPERRDSMLSAIRGGETLLGLTAQLMPDAHFRLVSMVSADPYGVTRTYARHVGSPDASRALPTISVYDPEQRQWLRRLGVAASADFKPVAPVTLRIGYEAEPPVSVPTKTVAADLPADRYLLNVAFKPGGGVTKRRLIAVTPANMLRQTMSELGPDGDYAPYLRDDTNVWAIVTHPGGTLYVSQFDDAVDPHIVSVKAYPILGALDRGERPPRGPARRLPDLTAWTPTPGVTARPQGDGLGVEGDMTAFGYQIMSPLIPAHEHDQITAHVGITVEGGSVCAGALNGTGQLWLVPADKLREDLTFAADATPGFRVVVANCNGQPTTEKSRFVLAPGTYMAVGADFYVDRLLDAALEGALSTSGELAGGNVNTFPSGLTVTRATIEAPVQSVPPVDIVYKAEIVERVADVWSIKGRAQGAYSYLLRARDRFLDGNSRVIVKGRVEHGGISIGLLKNDKWAAQVPVTRPGDFIVVIAPPGRGMYSILVANEVQGDLQNAVTLTEIGVLPEIRR